MPKFPRREAEVIALADEMIAGYLANPGLFPSANVSAMQNARSLYGTTKDTQIAAQVKHDGWIDITTTGPHHQAGKGAETHGRID